MKTNNEAAIAVLYSEVDTMAVELEQLIDAAYEVSRRGKLPSGASWDESIDTIRDRIFAERDVLEVNIAMLKETIILLEGLSSHV